ncbi:MAG: hypothetical protein ACKO6B_05895, partial [Planctomycetia bacterium]
MHLTDQSSGAGGAGPFERSSAGPVQQPMASTGRIDEATALHRQLEIARLRHAAEVAELRRQILEARKLAGLGELLGTTTHEFNNALTTILNYAKLGLRHRDQPTTKGGFLLNNQLTDFSATPTDAQNL